MTQSDRPALHALAERQGILSSYVDTSGITRPTSDESRVAILAAMDIDASSEAAAMQALHEAERRSKERAIDPVIVQRVRRHRPSRLRYRPPPQERGRQIPYRLELEDESGETYGVDGRTRLRRDANVATLPLPVDPAPGYHRLRLELGSGAEAIVNHASFIVCPDSCVTAREILNGRRRFGIWTHLYSARRADDWGVGDVGVLQALADWAREIDAAFVGINPLHATRNLGADISPYSPVSRLFRNIVYIDIQQVPELKKCPQARSLLDSATHRDTLSALRGRSNVDYEGVMAAKRHILRAFYHTFTERHRGRETDRGQAYARFIGERGEQLIDFATFIALADHLDPAHGPDWRNWPAAYRDPRSTEVAEFRRQHLEEIDEQCYLQFELDRQLAAASSAASELAIGLYGDLAIGSAASGCDPWMFPGLFVQGATVGAPPDDYAAEGQDWSLPPVDPARLRSDAYRYWILLLRSALEHMGALRIDHVMGLLRQYWVPAGRLPTEGAYVRYPADDLFGILALESRRHGALIIGEDLGTVPRVVPGLLKRWGILSSRVLYFEKDRRGNYRSSRRYSRRALVTANTHDHPPLAGFWSGRDLELRRQAGNIGDDVEATAAAKERERERSALAKRLRREGCLRDPELARSYPDLCAGVHTMLSRTPAPLVGVWLDDLAGETDPVNLPGIGLDRYPSWSRRLTANLEDLRQNSSVHAALGALAHKRR
jgi:4-alpha-glucanotransferase